MEINKDKLKTDMKEFYSRSKPYLEQLKKHDLSVFGKYIKKIIRYVPAKSKVLDVGCGVGQVSNFLAGRGYNVIGTDISQLLIEEAKKNGKANFRVMDALNLEFEDKRFDCVISAETIEHIPDPEKMLSEIHRVLKNGGILVLRFPNRQNKVKQLSTLIKKRPRFEIVNPNLGADVYGEDEDLCYLASTADIIVYLRERGFKILETKPWFWRAGLIIAKKDNQ